MLQDFFEPISKSLQEDIRTYSRYQIGKVIDFYGENFPEISQTKIALLGLDDSIDTIRTFFYKMNQNFKNLKIADLGNLKTVNDDNITTVLRELFTKNIIPIIIGSSLENTYDLYNAYQTPNRLNNMVIVDEKIPFTVDKRKKNSFYLNKIIDTENHNLFNLGVIGYQSHFVDKRTLSYFDSEFFEYQRLGQIKNHLEETEPIIRDADLMSFNLSVLKKIEVPGCRDASPSGIFTEDACQLTYYAGMSDKMSGLGIFGYNPEIDRDNQTAQVVSQIIWYFLFGYYNRKQDYPVSMGNFTEYIVNFKKSDYHITFWKSSKSDRWWMEVPVKDKRQKRHRLIPCSYQDYLQASREELPERLLKAYKRFGE